MNSTNLETVDISIDEGVAENDNQEINYNTTLEKRKRKGTIQEGFRRNCFYGDQ